MILPHILIICFPINCSSIQGHPPEHHGFKDKRVPAHITYAYKEGATIVKNDDFYKLPDNETHTIDLLFLISNTPVSTTPFPDTGSKAYVGLVNVMELSVDELSSIFPEMLRGETKSSNRCEELYVFKQHHSMSPITCDELWSLHI